MGLSQHEERKNGNGSLGMAGVRRILMSLLLRLWAGPTTILGLAASVGSLALPRRSGSILICRSSRGFARWFLLSRGYHAITLGHLVLLAEEALPEIIAHEMIHVRQGEKWGPVYIPAYLIAMLIARLRGGDPYWNNPFEIEARRKGEGQPPPLPPGPQS